MDIGFDNALKIAKKSVGDMTGDFNAEILKFDSKDGYYFKLQTIKGAYDVVVDRNGNLGRFSKEDNVAMTSTSQAQGAAQPRSYEHGHNDHHDYDDHVYSQNNRPSPGQRIPQQAAVEKAISYVGGGRVEKVRPTGDGYEIEINRGLMKGRMKVLVDGSGAVRAQKQSRMSDMLDFELD
jgi:hypothetical protein